MSLGQNNRTLDGTVWQFMTTAAARHEGCITETVVKMGPSVCVCVCVCIFGGVFVPHIKFTATPTAAVMSMTSPSMLKS